MVSCRGRLGHHGSGSTAPKGTYLDRPWLRARGLFQIHAEKIVALGRRYLDASRFPSM